MITLGSLLLALAIFVAACRAPTGDEPGSSPATPESPIVTDGAPSNRQLYVPARADRSAPARPHTIDPAPDPLTRRWVRLRRAAWRWLCKQFDGLTGRMGWHMLRPPLSASPESWP